MAFPATLSVELRDTEVSESNLNAVIQLTTWILLALITLVMCFRLLTRFFIVQGTPFSAEDALILVSYILGLGESVTMVIPASAIFGKTLDNISREELINGLKARYAGDILFVLCLGLSKLSVCSGLNALSPHPIHRRTTAIVASLVAFLTIIALFATAFQCGLQGPWELGSATCFNQRVFLTYHGISSILTDAALIAIPVTIICPLKMAMRMRVTILSFYFSRVLAIASTTSLLIYLPRLFEEDFTLEAFPYYLSLQFVQFSSILAGCAVYFWPFLRSQRSGLLQLNNSLAFSSHYPLAMLSTPNSRTPVTGTATNGRGTYRKSYIEITTDFSIGDSNSSNEQTMGSSGILREEPGVGLHL